MKLAAALSERADIQRHLSELSGRLNANARVQEGEAPSEKPEELLAQMDTDLARLEELVARINETNSKTLSGGKTITQMLARRDALSLRIKMLRSFLDEAANLTDRYSRTEIKVLSTVDVAELRKTVDGLSKEMRQLDETLQELNWTTELL